MPNISPQALQCAQDIVGSKDVQHIALVIEQYLRLVSYPPLPKVIK